MFVDSDRIRAPAQLPDLLRAFTIVFAVCLCMSNPASAQTTPQSVLKEIDPAPAPGFAGSQWMNTNHADEGFLKDKVVLVNFWATWCPPCIEELPSIQKLWESLDRNDFEVVAVNVGEPQAQVQNFLDRFNPRLEFAVVLDLDLEIYKSWKVSPIPTTYIVDRNNNQRFRGLGDFDFNSKEIRAMIEPLLEE